MLSCLKASNPPIAFNRSHTHIHPPAASNQQHFHWEGRKTTEKDIMHPVWSFRIDLWELISNPSSYIATSKVRLKGEPLGSGLGLLRKKKGFIWVEHTGKKQGHRLVVNNLVWPSFHKAQRKDSLCCWRCCCHKASMAAIRFGCACLHLIYLSVNMRADI